MKELWPGWETVEVIGKGGFGKVYKIRKKGSERDGEYFAALKVMSIPASEDDLIAYKEEGYDDKTITEIIESQVDKIADEFKLMAKFKGNSNIVSYEDHMMVPHEDGIGYDILIRMELLTSLPKLCMETDFPVEESVKIGIDICKALELCQKKNIIHRDIKPQNIFVNEFGDYKLGDFGIARSMDHTTHATKIGTYTCMAPEVYRGDAYNSSIDMYSLGIVLYWLLNEKRLPFLPLPPAAPTATMINEAQARRLSGEPLPPPKNGSDKLKNIVLKACAFNSNDRYTTATEMRRDLEKEYAILLAAMPDDYDRAAVFSAGAAVSAAASGGSDVSAAVTGGVNSGADSISGETEVLKSNPMSDANDTVVMADETVVLDNGAVSSDKGQVAYVASGSENTSNKKKLFAVIGSIAGIAIVALIIILLLRGCGNETGNSNDDNSGVASGTPTYGISETEGSGNNIESTASPENTQAADSTNSSVAGTSRPSATAAPNVTGTGKPSTTVTASPSSTANPVPTNSASSRETYSPDESPNDVPTTPTPTTATSVSLPPLSTKVGDVVKYGKYEQDNNTSNGKEDIEWIVLAKENNRILVTSKYALDCQPYNTSYIDITWENCTLRTWLNSTFINNAFSSAEKSKIPTVTVKAEDNPEYGTDAGNDVRDKVFLLNISNVKKFFSSDSECMCYATAYAKAQGASTGSGYGTCYWWLRSPGGPQNYAATLDADGSINYGGHYVLSNPYAVRPAMWIDLNI